MKLLVINGSHRGKRGFTNTCIDKIVEGAESSGAVCSKINLSEKKITECIACAKCQSRDHYLKCICHDKDDAASIFDEMKCADLIIFATPVYVFSMSGLLKKFLDRYYSYGNSGILALTKSGLLFHHTIREIFVKPFAVLICGDNIEDRTYENTINYFKNYSSFMDAKQVGVLVRKSASFFQRPPINDGMRNAIDDVYLALNEVGKELAAVGKIKSATERRVSRNILPMPPVFKLLNKFNFAKKMMIRNANKMKEENSSAVLT